jgi:hypothetical protein
MRIKDMKVFEVIKLDSPMPWTVQHRPTGLYVGSFHYKRHALAAVASLESVAVQYPELTEAHDHYGRAEMNALFEARKPHTAADLAQAKAAEAKRKKVQL